MDYNSKYKSSEIEAMLDKIKNFDGGGVKTAVVYHGTEDTTIELTPNVVHKWDAIDSLSLTLPEDEDGYTNHYKIVFTAASSAFILALPYYVQWINAELPTFEEGKQYEISIEGGRVLWAKFDKEIKTGILEYVESDGYDYVLTDIYISDAIYGMRCKSASLFPSGGSSSKALAGTRESSSSTAFTFWYRQAAQGRRVYWNNETITLSAYEEGVPYEDAVTSKQLTSSSSYPLVVFGMNDGGTISYKGAFRLYSLEFVDADGNAIIDLRPYRRKSDGAVGLYDVASGKFYESVNGNLIPSEL